MSEHRPAKTNQKSPASAARTPARFTRPARPLTLLQRRTVLAPRNKGGTESRALEEQRRGILELCSPVFGHGSRNLDGPDTTSILNSVLILNDRCQGTAASDGRTQQRFFVDFSA